MRVGISKITNCLHTLVNTVKEFTTKLQPVVFWLMQQDNGTAFFTPVCLPYQAELFQSPALSIPQHVN